MEDGGEFCSVGLENELLHLLGRWRKILLLLIWCSICMEDVYLWGWLRCTFREDFTECLFSTCCLTALPSTLVLFQFTF